MTYRLQFHEDAVKEWRKLDSSVRKQFEKKFVGVLQNPRVPANALSEMKDCYKIKLRKAGVRLVYEVEDATITVSVITIGKRDKNTVYKMAVERLKS
jgi:mRNA interferase RelE/StbE